MRSCLVLDGVSKSFGALRAVDSVSCNIPESDIFAIVGPNGAGKTTLFNLVTGSGVHADSGTVMFYDTDITHMGAARIFHTGLARTFQRESCFDSLTVAENLRVAGAYGSQRLRRRSLSKAVDQMVGEMSLSNVQFNRAGDLPLYDKKKLMIGTALIGNPRALMLDEPVAGLTPAESEAFTDVVKGLRDRGLTIVIIEHVLPVVFALASRVMVMDAGKVIAQGAPEEIAHDPRVIAAYVGAPEEVGADED